MQIAGKRTDKQWFARKNLLQSSPTAKLWNSTFNDFYLERINTRYLAPIQSIPNKMNGEGFAIVALFCTLIEFLESCEQGVNFRYAPPAQLLPNEYGQKDAAKYFKDFLKTREPFKTLIPQLLVDSFYRDVRCGLLHEARTKGVWFISALPSNGIFVSQTVARKTLFRRELIPALEKYFEDYRHRLSNDANTQQAFIRKFDFLCSP